METRILDEQELTDLAARTAPQLEPPMVIYLEGDLGAGKTTFARALIRALGHPGRVKSPTYGLLEHYTLGDISVLHLDLYRIEDPGELEYLAVRDLYDERTVLLVEWPDRGAGYLPAPDLVLDFGETDEVRFIHCTPRSRRGRTIAQKVLQGFC